MSETSAIRSDVSSRSAKKRAKVWEHIETEIIDGKEHSSCKYCKTKLSTEPGTVSSESAFSCAGRLLGKDRTSLTPETLEALICCKDWIVGFSEEDEGPCLEGCRTCDLEEYN